MSNNNPFSQIEERFNELEKLIIKLQSTIENQKSEKDVLPETGDINLAVSITGLKKSTIYKMTSTGEIPFSKPSSGKLIFISKDLMNWIKKK